LFAIPESPYFLSQKGRMDEANKGLNWFLLDGDLVEATKADIARFLLKPSAALNDLQMTSKTDSLIPPGNDDHDDGQQPQGIYDGSDPKSSYKLCLMCCIMAFSRLSGVTQFSYFMVDIMDHCNVSVSSTWASAGVTLFEIIGNFMFLTYICELLIFLLPLLPWSCHFFRLYAGNPTV
jgi:hypothetical protein